MLDYSESRLTSVTMIMTKVGYHEVTGCYGETDAISFTKRRFPGRAATGLAPSTNCKLVPTAILQYCVHCTSIRDTAQRDAARRDATTWLTMTWANDSRFDIIM
nr:uncharacterized protein LOC124218781 [Neodiprion pinetum]